MKIESKQSNFLFPLIILLYINTQLVSQVNFNWAKRIGDTGSEISSAISLDSAGNIYTLGDFSGTVDFDPGTGVYNLTGGGTFISKLDPIGNFIWAKSILNSNSGPIVGSMKIDVSGNIYIIGTFSGTVDFDPGAGVYNLTSQPNYNNFILKLDKYGNFLWAIASSGLGRSINLDLNGNIYVTGDFSGTNDFDPGIGIQNLISNGSSDIFILKLDRNGNFMWAKSMGGIASDFGYSVISDNFGNVYSTGNFSGTVDFDPSGLVYNLTQGGVFISEQRPAGPASGEN